MKVKLTCLNRNPSLNGGLRTTSVIGETDSIPGVGKSFSVIADPLEVSDMIKVRCVSTSPVIDVQFEEGIYTFLTESESIYTVEVL